MLMGDASVLTIRIRTLHLRNPLQWPRAYLKDFTQVNSDGVLPSNYAFERSVRGWAVGAAGAWESLAPAAPASAVPRPAQRGR